MLKDWQNRGILLWSTSVSSVTVAASVTAYSLHASTVDALEVVLGRDDTDIQLTRIIRDAAVALDIVLHDHLIIGKNREVSLHADGYI